MLILFLFFGARWARGHKRWAESKQPVAFYQDNQHLSDKTKNVSQRIMRSHVEALPRCHASQILKRLLFSSLTLISYLPSQAIRKSHPARPLKELIFIICTNLPKFHFNLILGLGFCNKEGLLKEEKRNRLSTRLPRLLLCRLDW